MTRELEIETSVEGRISPSEFSKEFLEKVIEALPEALVIIDGDRNIVMANRTARVHPACLKCYQCFHHEDQPCEGVECPVELVNKSKSQVRVYHTHYGENNREMSVAIDAAPMLDADGEVQYTIETCRDVTERALARRLSRIGNLHMAMAPLLAEYAAQIQKFACCTDARIDLFDEDCVGCGSKAVYTEEPDQSPSVQELEERGASICVRDLAEEFEAARPLLTEHGSLRFDDIAESLARLPEHLQGSLGACVPWDRRAVVLVPIRYAEARIGTLQVADERPGFFTADLVKSLERLSFELGAAIRRVRVEETLQDVRNSLEARVDSRTEELTKSNEALQKEIEERGRLERELLDASVKEQRRIGQELHDGLGQELTGISYMAQNLVMSLKRQELPDVESAKELAKGIQTVVGEIQQIVRGLVPLEIGAADLSPALELLAANVERNMGVTCRFEMTGRQAIMEDGTAIQMYRIAQEAITNAIKHAQGDEIWITLSGGEDEVGLRIADNGVGIQAGDEQGPGCGLRSMRHRAWAIGGQFDIGRGRRGGTVVECTVARPSVTHSDKRELGDGS